MPPWNAAGTRVSYVPAAAIVVRTDALRAIGGFDECLRHNEMELALDELEEHLPQERAREDVEQQSLLAALEGLEAWLARAG